MRELQQSEGDEVMPPECDDCRRMAELNADLALRVEPLRRSLERTADGVARLEEQFPGRQAFLHLLSTAELLTELTGRGVEFLRGALRHPAARVARTESRLERGGDASRDRDGVMLEAEALAAWEEQEEALAAMTCGVCGVPWDLEHERDAEGCPLLERRTGGSRLADGVAALTRTILGGPGPLERAEQVRRAHEELFGGGGGGSWLCSCTAGNYASAERCSRCGRRRP